jgi:hypothetical protein
MFTIFEKLGGEDEALNIIREGGEVREQWPSLHTLKVWKRNKELPGTIIKKLMMVCDERGIRYCAADFQSDGESDQ